jgi:pyruvate carboxylase
MFIYAESTDALAQLTNLGAAGVMGAMWLWERRNSQKRDEQLDDAHTRILGDRVQLDQLIEVVRTNAEAITRLSSLHDQLLRTLERKT